MSERKETVPPLCLRESRQLSLEFRQITLDFMGKLLKDSCRFVRPENFTRKRESKHDAVRVPHDIVAGYRAPELPLQRFHSRCGEAIDPSGTQRVAVLNVSGDAPGSFEPLQSRVDRAWAAAETAHRCFREDLEQVVPRSRLLREQPGDGEL